MTGDEGQAQAEVEVTGIGWSLGPIDLMVGFTPAELVVGATIVRGMFALHFGPLKLALMWAT